MRKLPHVLTPVLATLITGAVMATPVLANTLEGTLNGEKKQWHIYESQGQSTANYSEIGPGLLSITVQGHEEKKFAVKGSLGLSITMMNGQPIGAPEVTFFPEKKMLPNYSDSKAQDWKVRVEPSSDNTMKVTGHYKGTLYRVEKIGQAPSSSDTMTVDVRFDVLAKHSN